jgi:hypothetical protein
LNGSTVTGNTANFEGGGVLNLGALSMTDSTVSGNSAGGVGGGISTHGAGYAGLEALSLEGSSVRSSTAGLGGGGIFAGFSSTGTLTDSTVSGNVALDGLHLGGPVGGGISRIATAHCCCRAQRQ